MNQLDQLKASTTVVADTGNFNELGAFKPQDATTNPSLILKAVQQADYAPLLKDVTDTHPGKPLDELIDRVLVRFGLEILKIVPGRVSTEVDARSSFDRPAIVTRARRIMALYADAGIGPDRVLIKIASTWEGIQAARELEADGIHCNLTLLFSFAQAVACADAGVTLISPFVGRITDWYKKSAGSEWNDAANAGPADPGVKSVQRIYTYFKQQGIKTVVMGASFRNVGQIAALAGCDLLTISPDLLGKLQHSEEPLPRVLSPELANAAERMPQASVDEAAFRYALNDDAMANDKLAEGIRTFAGDAVKLDGLIKELQ